MVEESHTALKSSIPYDASHHFPLENIPFGAFTNPESNQIHVATRIGDFVVDLAVLESHGLFNTTTRVFDKPTINEFLKQGADVWHSVRVRL